MHKRINRTTHRVQVDLFFLIGLDSPRLRLSLPSLGPFSRRSHLARAGVWTDGLRCSVLLSLSPVMDRSRIAFETEANNYGSGDWEWWSGVVVATKSASNGETSPLASVRVVVSCNSTKYTPLTTDCFTLHSEASYDPVIADPVRSPPGHAVSFVDLLGAF